MRNFAMVVVIVSLTGPVSGQGAAFRASTHVVPVVTTVVDSTGRLVARLERDDFTILDNGKPQEISFFDDQAQPFTAVVMLDNSASMTGNFRLLKTAAAQFIMALQTTDRAQVGAFSDDIDLIGSFTSDHHELISALDHLPFGDRTRLYDGIGAAIGRLGGVDGRKVVVVFTDGDDTASDTQPEALLEQARALDVSVSIIRLEGGDGESHDSRSRRRLMRVVDETGGRYVAANTTGDLIPAFARVAEELHGAYTLGFSPTQLDGRTHAIAVRVKGPALRVQARRSYVASPVRLEPR